MRTSVTISSGAGQVGLPIGVSLYGAEGRDAGFTARHPALRTSKGTIQLRPEDATGISDAELTALIRAALEPGAVTG